VMLLASAMLTSLVVIPSAQGFQASGQYASTVVGEPNFVSSTNEATPNHLFRPFRITFDSSGDLWVADENNNRVLEFKPPFYDGMDASVVIGQANFTSMSIGTAQDRLNEPVGLAFDSSGNLWVTDSINDRVLEFKPPFSDGMNASLELGQPAGLDEFTSSVSSSGPTGFNFPVDATFDAHGDLWVTDRENNRVLEFKPPFSDGMDASSVIGQDNLTSVPPYVIASPSGLFGPNGIAFDPQGNLWVADENFNRILEFPASSLGANGPSAVMEIGQPAGPSEFQSTGVATNASGLAAPLGIAFSPSGDLWVSDRANNRVLEFAAPFSDGMHASAVLGTPAGARAFDSNVTGLAENLLMNPLGIAFSPSGDLWVADQLNNRVLEFSGAALVTAGDNVDVPTTTDQTVVNVTSSGNACYRIGDQTACHLSANQTATGVQTDVVGVASASTANVYSSYLGQEAPAYAGAPPLRPSAAAYYGIAVTGIGNGTATVCIDHPQSVASMAYYSDGDWASPTSISRSGPLVCGTIPLSAMAYGNIVVGVGVPNAPVSTALGGVGQALGVIAFFVAVLIGAYALVLRRRGRKSYEEDEPEEEEAW